MASLFDLHSARHGFTLRVDCEPGSIERDFVNRLSSIVKSAVDKGLKSSPELNPDSFRLQYLLDEISTKSPYNRVSNSVEERSKLAIAKTMSSNEHCRRVNELESWDPRLKNVLVRARHLIQGVLGKFDYGIYEQSAFSGGASTSHKRGRSCPFSKYSSLEHGCLEVTPRAHTRLCALIENTPTMWRSFLTARFNGLDPIRIVDRDVVKTVPKNSKIDRTILIQPAGLNILQKAIGNAIRRKLKSVGVDLRDQSLNQELARVGSLRRSHATIDLSSASDTVNARIVYELLPYDWYRELEALRCDKGTYVDEFGNLTEIQWHMFSAMGNAYTFELESMIFWAIATATAQELGSYVGCISVYGDDIIVPNSIALQVCENLTLCGFIVNNEKTHIEGNFRESCGAHWYHGICVKPFYIRDGLTEISSIMRLANQLRKWSTYNNVCDPRFYKLWRYLANFVPSYLFGGWDLESSHSLVTPDQPRKKLVPVTAQAVIGGEGALAACFQAWSASSTLNNASGYFLEVIEDREFSDLPSDVVVKSYDNLFYIRRNRPYGRYTSPPTWEIPLQGQPVSNNGLVEHHSY